LGIGINIFQWTISNGPCANSTTSDTVIINVFDNEAADANAGVDQELCLPSTSTFMAATPALGAAVGTWSVIQGTGSFSNINSANAQVSGLSVGENIFQWFLDNGPCGNSTDLVSIFVFDPGAPIANAGPDQEFCTPVSSTTMAANLPDLPGVGTWTLISGTGTISNPNSPTTTISGLTIGENIFEWSIYNGPCAEPTNDLVSIFIFDENAPNANAGADQELCLPQNSTNMTAIPAIFPGIGTWTLIQGGGVIAQPNNPNTLITNLPLGVNIFRWTVDNGPCANGITFDTVSILVFSEDSPLANAGPDQQFCSPTAATVLNAVDPVSPQTGTWTVIQGSGFVSNPNDPNSIVSGLSLGENILAWTIYNGSCDNGSSIDFVSIFIFDANAPAANAGPDQELCLPQNTTTMNALAPIFPATGQWTLLQGSGAVLSPGSPSSQVINLGVGENIFQWTVSNGPCAAPITTDIVSIFVFEEDAPVADAGPDQEVCTPTSTVVMNALDLISPQTGTWTLIQGNGTISDSNDPDAIISGLTVGINIFEWAIDNGPCTNASSSDQVAILVYDQNAPPANAGEDQELCLPTNSTVMTATAPIVPATGNWVLVQGNGTIADPGSPTSAITDLAVGVNIFQWTVSNGPCENSVTSDTVTILVFEEDAPLADAGPDLEICTPESCVTLQAAIPTSPTTGTWTILSGSGFVSDVNDPNAELCDLTVGETVLQWTVYNGPCEAGESIDFVVVQVFSAFAPTADAGSDQELCSPELSTNMQGNTPLFPSTGQWTLLSGSGNIENAADPNTLITDLAVGTNEFQWQVSNGPCIEPTSDFVTITVYDPDSPDADAGPDQYFCSPDESTTLEGNVPIFPAVGTWEVIAGEGNITNANDPASTITDLGLGINILIWTIYNGPCENTITTDTVVIYVNDLSVADANAGADQFYCGFQEVIQMEGSVTIGNTATGEWTIISGGGEFADTANEASQVFNVPIGQNTYVWTVDNLECGISSDTVNVWVYDNELVSAFAGLGSGICENLFEPFELNALAAEFPALGYWTILEGNVEISDSLDANAEVLTLGSIENLLDSEISVLSWNIDNGVCGTFSDTIVFSLNDCLTIEIPDAFSPNGDLVNDLWVIDNLVSYPLNSVKIYNRWGALIYEASPYLNDWDGKSTHPSAIGGDLPVSTYYYILDLGNGVEPYSGFVYLRR
jgi:gliding motility-associated-like protein